MITIPGYDVIELIGSGGMAMVYLAEHPRLGHKLAIKVLSDVLTSNESVRQRFVQEAKMMVGLRHKGIVTVTDFIEKDSILAIVMDYVDGRTLDEMIGKEVGPIPWEKALRLFRQIVEAVGYAHSKGIVHRDVKPSNVLVSNEGEVKVTDFGIAKIAGQNGLTRTGTQMGTLYYEAPEQVRGAKDVDHRADIYSLGMTLYEMLAGRLPFDANGDTSEFQVMSSIVNREEHLDPRQYYPHIPEWLVNVVRMATSADPSHRQQNCTELLASLYEQKQDSTKVKNANSESPYTKSGEIEVSASNQVRFSRKGECLTDKKSGLLWLAGPNIDMTWKEAYDWVKSLGAQWRLPSADELKTINETGIFTHQWGFSFSVWTDDRIVSKGAKCISFSSGLFKRVHLGMSKDKRTFAVRGGIQCSNCGMLVDALHEFCSNCGKPVKGQISPQALPSQKSDSSRPKPRSDANLYIEQDRFLGGLKWFTGWALAWIIYQMILVQIPTSIHLYRIPIVGSYLTYIAFVFIYVSIGLILADLFYTNFHLNWRHLLSKVSLYSTAYAIIALVVSEVSGYAYSYSIIARVFLSLALALLMYMYLYGDMNHIIRLRYILISCFIVGIFTGTIESTFFLPHTLFSSYDIMGFIHPWFLFALVIPLLISVEVGRHGRLFN